MKKYIEVRINIARAKLTDPASEIKKIYISAKKATDGFWDTIKEFEATEAEQAIEFAHNFAKKCSKGNRNIIWVMDDNKRPVGAYINGEKWQPRY